MEISFIIPAFNRLELTRACVASLQASLPAGLACEIVIVDNGSTDGTAEWARLLPSPPFVVLRNETNLGYAPAVNRAARAARGQILALLNNDLVFAPGWLGPMRRALERQRRAGIVGNIQVRADTGALDHAGMLVNLNGKPEHLNGSTARLRLVRAVSPRQAITGACCLIWRELFLDAGGFDEGFVNGGEDVDLCYRLRQRGLRVLVANRSVVRHQVSATPGRKDHDERNSRRFCRRWRDQLIEDGARLWAGAYLAAHWQNPRDFDTWLLWQAVLFRSGLLRRPPRPARDEVARNLAREEEHWQRLLDATEGCP